MKHLSLCLVGLTWLTLAEMVQAGNCENNIPPSNPDSAYTADLINGTVKDTRTGLMWKTCTEGQTWNGSTCEGQATPYTWSAALELPEAAVFAGYDDWRIPNVKELESLVEDCRKAPSINDTFFPNTPNAHFWSASPRRFDDPIHSWYLGFEYTLVEFGYTRLSSGNRSHDHSTLNGITIGAARVVRLVRGGQSFASFNGGSQTPATTFLSENLPDGTYQIGPATKRWRFKNGTIPIQGLKAVRVSADAGLGIAATEVSLGDLAANAEVVVQVPVNPTRGAQAILRSVWKLADGAGKDVRISNSATNTFWMALRTNRAPRFSPRQLDSIGGQSGAALSLPLIGEDDDGDALTFCVQEGSGCTHISGTTWRGSFDTGGDSRVLPLKLQVSDGLETATKTVNVVVFGSNGLGNFFADVPFPGQSVPMDTNTVYAAAHYLAGKGIVLGCGTNSENRPIFCPAASVTQAEALKMLLRAAEMRELVTLDAAPTVPDNLIVYDQEAGIYRNNAWAAPYAFTAQRLGLIANVYTWDPSAPVSRIELARWLGALLPLQVPLALLEAQGMMDRYRFDDAASFASEADYSAARRAAFFGYLGALGSAFGPDATLNRGDFAVIAAKVLRTPRIDGLTLSGTTTGTRFGQTLPVITHGQTLSITGVENLDANEILMTGPAVLEEWIEPTQNYVRIGVALYDGRSLGAVRYIKDLATTPITLDTNGLAIRAGTLLQLIVLIESETPTGSDMERSGVSAVYTIPLAVDFPDRDGDGVRNDLDRWADDWRFSQDSNGNGYPNEVDGYLATLGIQATAPVVIGGVNQGYTHGTALMNGYPPYDGERAVFQLIVRPVGSGQGQVTSQPAGIACGKTCTATFARGTSVTLTASPKQGYLFGGWSGACQGAQKTCTLKLDQDREAAASFLMNEPGSWQRVLK